MDKTDDVVVVRRYGLLSPLDWDEDVTDELRRMNRLWNNLVEIERDNRDRYWALIDSSSALADIAPSIHALESERADVLTERNRRRAAARSKSGADTGEQDSRLTAIREELRPLYGERKKRLKKARVETKPQLEELEAERKASVKDARQRSGCFWSNYNAVVASYQTARVKAMKEGGTLHFRRFHATGRLVNQIQGGMSAEDLFACRHSQAQIQNDVLRIKAFSGRDETNRPFVRHVHFPIKLHRSFPPGAVIKDVTINISRVGVDWRYAVTFTCRAPASGAPDAGVGAAGVNLGWKRVSAGLRVATAVHSDGDLEHIVLPNRWIDRMARVTDLQGRLDDAVNEVLPQIKSALDDLPAWSEEGPEVEGYPAPFHRWLSSVKKAPRMSAERVLVLLRAVRERMEEEPNLFPLLHDVAHQLESWRSYHKKKWLEMVNLRDKLIAQRKDIYRVFAKRLADRAGLVMVDDTSYRDAARVKRPDGVDPELHEQARANRVLAAPYELRLAIEQAQQKRRGYAERCAERINICHGCGSNNISGELMRVCHHCGLEFDIDENAARNLLAHATAEPLRAVE